jgi:hypothetical protein
VLGGLWQIRKGAMEKPVKIGSGGLLFLPQRSDISDWNIATD